MESNPLVSVFIVTYNSSNYIIEALDSVKAQTYKNIELIVSDDKSSDNTVEIVKGWLSQNSERFVRTELVEALVNTGTSGNYNRAVAACKGEWLKMVDGDDLLYDHCIQDNIDFINKTPCAKVVFSDMDCFYNDRDGKKYRYFTDSTKSFFILNDANAQLQMLLERNILPSLTCFIRGDLLKSVPYDENYNLLEDYPMWINLLRNGNQFYYFDLCTARYRLGDSVSHNKKELFPSSYVSLCKRYFWTVLYPLIMNTNNLSAYNSQIKYFLWVDLCTLLLNNKNNKITRVLSSIIRRVINMCYNFK